MLRRPAISIPYVHTFSRRLNNSVASLATSHRCFSYHHRTHSMASATASSSAQSVFTPRVSSYSLHGLRLPISHELSERLRQAAQATNSHSDSKSLAPHPPNYTLNCDVDLEVTHDGQSSPSKPFHPSPVLSLSEVHSTLSFLIAHFPFDSPDRLLDGATKLLLVWSKLSQGDASVAVQYAMPVIRKCTISATITTDERLQPHPTTTAAVSHHATSSPLYTGSLTRIASDVDLRGRDINLWGHVDIILECTLSKSLHSPSSHSNSYPHAGAESGGLYCLNIAPSQSIPLHTHQIMHESEMIFSHSVHVQDSIVPFRFGKIHSWQRAPHTYKNTTKFIQRVLCIDVPLFIPSDEILVESDGKPLTFPQPTSPPNHVWQDNESMRAVEWTFPGALENQVVKLVREEKKFEKEHAVLVFVWKNQEVEEVNGNGTTSSQSTTSPQLLFVHHRKRGWELPGGKVDEGESALDAVKREVREEAGVELDPESIVCIGQYQATTIEPTTSSVTATSSSDAPSSTSSIHIKSVYSARVSSSHSKQPLTHETSEARFIQPPIWQEICASGDDAATTNTDSSTSSSSSASSPHMKFSRILHDNVYPICLELALANYATPTKRK